VDETVVVTKIPSNLIPISCGCVHLVTLGHFRSRDKDGDHTTRSAIAENPILRANFIASFFIEPELLPIEVFHCKNTDFRPFCFCNLDFGFHVRTSTIYFLEIYGMRENELHMLRLSKADRHTDRQTYGTEHTYRVFFSNEFICRVIKRIKCAQMLSRYTNK